MTVIENKSLYDRETEACIRRIAIEKMKKLGFGALILGETDEGGPDVNGWHESGRQLAAELESLTPKSENGNGRLEILNLPVSDTLAMQAACEIGAVAMVLSTVTREELRVVDGTKIANALALPRDKTDETDRTVSLVAPLGSVIDSTNGKTVGLKAWLRQGTNEHQ